MKCKTCNEERPPSKFYCIDAKQGLYSPNCIFCMFTGTEPIPLERCHKVVTEKTGSKKSNLTPSTTTPRNLAKRLLRLHDKKRRTWRDISGDYPGVKFGTLNRIAKSRGEWIPADTHIQELLGIKRKPRVKKPIPLLGTDGWESVFFKQPKKRRSTCHK